MKFPRSLLAFVHGTSTAPHLNRFVVPVDLAAYQVRNEMFCGGLIGAEDISSLKIPYLSDGIITHESSPFADFHQTESHRRHKATWEYKFTLLRLFKRVYGHCNVPPSFVVGGIKLGGWVETQRKEYRKFRLGIPSSIINDRRIQRLERNGFEWVSGLYSVDSKVGASTAVANAL
eukprot:CAMPEP_0197451104 /NCGR_PEP_ID=MMETSP1175-20131217/27709_1 /TAXON_ID=1003142 /ORGANISM="Triceratium dubium, Strain CCMP147" /LENGTH=174 /DNA_ID=CAMNT_0042983715 /DNA_START=46 /DNA_END=570 /DNA_ORIENTATION=+